MILPKEFASESGHFYWPDGRPCHEQPCKSRPGEMRNTTLKDARKLGLYPSVSGILSIQAKPGLDNWKKEQVAKASWGWVQPGSQDEWVEFVLREAESQMSKARDLGTEIHGAIERHLKNYIGGFDFLQTGGVIELLHAEHINGAVAALKEFGAWGQPFRAERSFASPLGYGGCLDFCTDTHISDFKCCDSLSKKLDYNDRLSQLSAYSMGVHGKLVKCANVFISTSEPGQYLLREWTKDELQYGWELFQACFQLYRIVNRFDPVLNAQEKRVSQTL